MGNGLSQDSFGRILDDAGLMLVLNLSPRDIDAILVQVVGKSHRQMTFEQFVAAMAVVACHGPHQHMLDFQQPMTARNFAPLMHHLEVLSDVLINEYRDGRDRSYNALDAVENDEDWSELLDRRKPQPG